MSTLDELDVPGYTEQAQLGYQGYLVKEIGFTEGLGTKFARCDSASDVPYGILIRGGEYAASGKPLSVVVRRRGVAPFIAHDTSLTVGAKLGTHSDGTAIAKVSNGNWYLGTVRKASESAGGIGEVMLDGPRQLVV